MFVAFVAPRRPRCSVLSLTPASLIDGSPQIELPQYSSLEIMRQRLLTAITYGDGFLLR